MNKKYYKMEVRIQGVIYVQAEDYDGIDDAIECVESENDIESIANAMITNEEASYVVVDKVSVEEFEY